MVEDVTLDKEVGGRVERIRNSDMREDRAEGIIKWVGSESKGQ